MKEVSSSWLEPGSETLASSASSEGRAYNSSDRRPSLNLRVHLGRSSQSIASGLLHFWDFLNFKKDREFMGIMVLFLDEKVNSVIHGFIHAGRAKNYMLSLKAGSIVKVDRFEVARCSSMYKIIDHPFVIRFISHHY
ncbi:hypothetical protein IGI04_026465 [Brassica rapa subsp. trilocularis]|uniref:DUF223 domain-containing protein n=1 Tax=Brassica rapa subsp. trilocularis TaxID=1813537 RepID=A0ABQ7KW60_BRACM|nr:hypothetical protein IGI04_026465 [Brassica rapa subsp. trilocularis]